MNRAAAAMARHAQVVAGNKPASVAAPAPLNQQDQLMLVALESDLQRLKDIQSHARRNEVKKVELLPRYRKYIATLIRDNQPRTPEIIVRNLIWAIDTADYERAMHIGLFAVAHNLPTPDGFRRDIRNLFIGDMSSGALALHKDNQSADWVLDLHTLVDGNWDLIDEVRADLNKAVGAEMERANYLDHALEFYRLADKLNPRVRVQRAIARLEKRLEANDAKSA